MDSANSGNGVPAALLRVVTSIESVATVPVVLHEVLALLDDPLVNQKRIEEVVTRDTAFATRMLRMANSPHFMPRVPIASLHQAVDQLGHEAVRTIALTNAVLDAVGERTSGFAMRRYWIHAATVAYLSREGARMQGGIDPEFAFIVGLIKDVGRVILARHAPDESRNAIRRASLAHEDFHESLLAIHGIDDAAVGAALCRHWRFPAALVDAVEHQFAPEKAMDRRVPILCRFAEFICGFGRVRNPGDDAEPPIKIHGLPECPFTCDQVVELIKLRQEEASRARQLICPIHGN